VFCTILRYAYCTVYTSDNLKQSLHINYIAIRYYVSCSLLQLGVRNAISYENNLLATK